MKNIFAPFRTVLNSISRRLRIRKGESINTPHPAPVFSPLATRDSLLAASPITPEQFRELFAQMMADPETRKLMFRSFAASYSLGGGTCATGASSTQDHIAKFLNAFCEVTDSSIVEVSGNMGIGTTNPGAKLEVKDGSGQIRAGNGGTVNLADSDLLMLRLTPDNSGYMHAKILGARETASDYKSYLAFFTESKTAANGNDTSVERMRIDSNGNVGIGVVPTDVLHLARAQNDVAIILDNTSASASKWAIDATAGDLLSIFNKRNSAGEIRLDPLSGGKLTVPNGNVGIGVASPSQKLEVAGNIKMSGARSVLFTQGDNGTTHVGGVQFLTDDNGVTNIWTPTDQSGNTVNNSKVTFGGFGLFNSNVVSVAVSGNLGIGVTNPASGYKLEVAGNVKISGAGNGVTFPDGTTQTTSATSASGGTVNRSARFTGPESLTSGKIYDDGAKIGIGTTNPSSSLTLGSSDVLGWDNGSGTTDTNLYRGGAGLLKSDSNLQVSGNVGIGTDAAEKLDVAGNAVFSGFLALAGTTINNSDSDGYVICKADTRIPGTNDTILTNNNNEMRGYQATMRYTRKNNSADANAVYGFTVSASGTTVTRVAGPNFITGGPWNNNKIEIEGVMYTIASVTSTNQLTITISAPTLSNVPAVVWQSGSPANLYPGLGWDVFCHGGAISLENMNVPSGDPEIRGFMKPFQSELYFSAKASGAVPYKVVKPTLNYVASLTAVHQDCTIDTWAGYMVDSPCEVCGAADKVTNGYGVWVQNLDDGISTLVAANAAAIKLDGLNQYGRILWRDRVDIDTDWCSIYRPDTTGVLELRATKANQTAGVVQTASGVNFNVGGSGGNAICNAAGYRVQGAAASGNYLRGDGTNFIGSAIQANDLPDASVTGRGAVNTTAQTFAGAKTFNSLLSAAAGITSTTGPNNFSGAGMVVGSLAIGASSPGTTIVDSSENISVAGYINTSTTFKHGGNIFIDSNRGLTNVQGASVNDAASPGSGAFQVGSSFSGSPKISMNTSNGNIGTLGVVNAVSGFQFNSTPGATGTFVDQNGNTVHVNGGIITSLT